MSARRATSKPTPEPGYDRTLARKVNDLYQRLSMEEVEGVQFQRTSLKEIQFSTRQSQVIQIKACTDYDHSRVEMISFQICASEHVVFSVRSWDDLVSCVRHFAYSTVNSISCPSFMPRTDLEGWRKSLVLGVPFHGTDAVPVEHGGWNTVFLIGPDRNRFWFIIGETSVQINKDDAPLAQEFIRCSTPEDVVRAFHAAADMEYPS